MVGFGLLMLMIGALLAGWPRLWHYFNAPLAEKEHTPDGRTLRRLRVQGVMIVAAAAALLMLQYLRQAPPG